MSNPLAYEKHRGLSLFGASAGLAVLAGAGLYLTSPATTTPLAFATALGEAASYTNAWLKYLVQAGPMAAARHANGSALLHTASALGLIPAAGALLLGVYKATRPRDEGESDFAKYSDLNRMGLTKGKLGPILGSFAGKVLYMPNVRHSLLIAPARTGKTRQAISSILKYPGSVIVVDPKKQIKTITRAARKAKGPVHAIDWTAQDTPDGWNFLALRNIPADPIEREKMADRLAALLVPIQQNEQGGSSAHFNGSARRHIAALALYEMYEADRTKTDSHPANLSGRFLQMQAENHYNQDDDKGDSSRELLLQLADHAHEHTFPARVIEALISWANMDGEERSGHISTLITKTQVLRSSAVRESLGKATFDFADFRKRPTSLYLSYPSSDAEAYGAITQIFFDTLFDFLLDNPQGPGEYPILLVMDEFRDYPFLRKLIPMFTKGGSAGVSMMIMVQDLSQLKIQYGETYKEILSNVDFIFAYMNPDVDTQKQLTAIVGKKAVNKNTKSEGKGFLKLTSTSEQGRDLIRPEQWGTIPFGKHILIVRGHNIRPVMCKAVFWDQHREFRKLVPAADRIST